MSILDMIASCEVCQCFLMPRCKSKDCCTEFEWILFVMTLFWTLFTIFVDTHSYTKWVAFSHTMVASIRTVFWGEYHGHGVDLAIWYGSLDTSPSKGGWLAVGRLFDNYIMYIWITLARTHIGVKNDYLLIVISKVVFSFSPEILILRRRELSIHICLWCFLFFAEPSNMVCVNDSVCQCLYCTMNIFLS